ncbi:uncharacterized protein LOC109872900 isoform X1 [Oncorhynchus kisutch]|uniref:uncharacterized protein LOC109872900 isoform X1 n=1 Tax=Oncorhynchus kisutch TaxID=8019 RepID=UPI0012DC94F7|nr:uncharacterized protein LOC109872900 isoform X1 [Oncorhynchus kisutch]
MSTMHFHHSTPMNPSLHTTEVSANIMAAVGLLWLVIATASILVKCEDAKSEDKNIYPAKIFGLSNVTKGVNVHFICSITGIRGPEEKLNVYLCKNGVGIRIAKLEKGENDAIFTMKDVTREDSGNYSCVYTRDKPVPSHLQSTGENLIVFHVDGEWKEIYPAKIFGLSNVTEGVNVNFICSITGIRGPEDKLNVYLCKNGVGIRIAKLEKGKDDAIFTMKDVTREDSGNYSCVYTRDKPVPSHLKSTGENLIVFHVDGEWKEGLHNMGGQGRAGLAAALVLLFLTLSLLLLLWRCWGILKPMIGIDHQPSETQDTDQTYCLISVVPVAAGVISPTDPTGNEALHSVITRVKRPEQQGETAIYAKVTKTKKEKEKQDPVYSLLNREDTMIL